MTTIPTTTAPAGPPATGQLTTVRFRAMATDVTVTAVATGDLARAATTRAREVFARVEAACTRFDPAAPLMRANAAPQQWHQVPRECFDAVDEAHRAHVETGGLFDPRILETLLRLGYDRSLPFGGQVPPRVDTLPATTARTASPSAIPVRTADRAAAGEPWQPGLDAAAGAVRLGEHPIDLGGIGKGLAVRWAAAELAPLGVPYLVEAGGDISVGGNGPEDDGWLVGIEDPAPGGGGDPELIAVLRLADLSCATSSVRVRTWHVDGRPVHHLIDPRTGDSSSSGLRAVTVVGPDPASAEVWSKALFLEGAAAIAQACRDRGLAAYWVSDTGSTGFSPTMTPYVMWQDDDAN